MPEAGLAPTAALLALWNDVDPALDAAYNDWHACEHVPERLTVPGIAWALRYARVGDAPMPRYLTLYGLRDPQVLDSPEYRRLLAHPTPASRAMRPALRHVSRWVCTLDLQDGIECHPCIVVRTSNFGASAPLPANALLIATRIPEAAALPWLAGDQSRPIEGDRLEAIGCTAAPAASSWAGAARYTRLPSGGSICTRTVTVMPT